jgi:hypothetical protein
MLPHADVLCVIRYKTRQVAGEEELPWCKELEERKREEERGKKKKGREKEKKKGREEKKKKGRGGQRQHWPRAWRGDR